MRERVRERKGSLRTSGFVGAERGEGGCSCACCGIAIEGEERGRMGEGERERNVAGQSNQSVTDHLQPLNFPPVYLISANEIGSNEMKFKFNSPTPQNISSSSFSIISPQKHLAPLVPL